MSVRRIIMNSGQFLRLIRSPASSPSLCTASRHFSRLCAASGINSQKIQIYPVRIVGSEWRTYSGQPTTQRQSTVDISSGNLADQALAFKAQQTEPPPNQEDEDKKAAENQIRALRFTMYAMGGLFISTGLYIFFVYGAPMMDQQGEEIKDEFSDLPFVLQYAKRAAAEIRNYVNYIVNPSRDKLLPDPVKPPYHQPYYTLLIELNGVLVHPEWTYKTGWRFKKRPGVDYFLSQVAGSGYNFEIVIYTHEPGMIAFPIVDALDQHGVVHYRLFRDSTKYENGVHLKDLDKVNRDLSRVLIVDCNEKAIHNHRNNAIVLPRWEGNDDDRALYDLAGLIQTIGNSEVKDVRGVLEYYADYPDPIDEYRRKQQYLAQQEKDALKKPGDIKVGSGTFTATGNLLGSLFRKS